MLRWAATFVGFVGAAIILEPWKDFDLNLFYPLLASVAWAASTITVKQLALHDPAETITMWLLILFTPLALAATWIYPDLGSAGSAWGIGEGPTLPQQIDLLLFLVGAGFLTAIAQLCLALSYKFGDASYVQPFDHVKLAFNIAISWLLFRDAPQGILWLGILMILGSSLSGTLTSAEVNVNGAGRLGNGLF